MVQKCWVERHVFDKECCWQLGASASSSSSRGGGGGGHKVAPAGGPPSHKTLRRTVLRTLNTLAYTCPFVPPWPTPIWPSPPVNYLHRHMLIFLRTVASFTTCYNSADWLFFSSETNCWNLTFRRCTVHWLSSIACNPWKLLRFFKAIWSLSRYFWVDPFFYIFLSQRDHSFEVLSFNK